jgi:hypothetical protein
MYLDYAEFQAKKGQIMYMKDWVEKLDAFLQFNEQDILQNAGQVSHDVAIALAEKEYEIYHKERVINFESDFDKQIKNILEKGKLK